MTKFMPILWSVFIQYKMLVGKPTWKWWPNRVILQVPYFVPYHNIIDTKKDQVKLVEIAEILSMIMKADLNSSKVLEFRFIRLQYPYLDSFILSQYLALNVNNYNFTKTYKILFNNAATVSSLLQDSKSWKESSNSLPGTLSGIKFELAGRLITQRNIPRKTVLNSHVGSINSIQLQAHNYTSKNKLGAYTVKVWLSQK